MIYHALCILSPDNTSYARPATCQAVKGPLGPADPRLGAPTPAAPAEASRPRRRPLSTSSASKGSRGVVQVVSPGGGGGLREASSAGAREQRALSRAVVWQRKASRQPPAALSHLPAAAAAAAVMLLQVQPILSSDFPIVRLSSIESDSEWALIPLGRARTQQMKC